MLEFLSKGGAIMIPLFICSIVALGLTLERIWSLRTARVLPKAVMDALQGFSLNKGIDRLMEACNAFPSSLSTVVKLGLTNRDKSRQENVAMLHNTGRRVTLELEWGLVTLEIVAGISPLLGLLGTVLGMVEVFDVISVLGLGQATALSKGISEALVTTITGLSIAIPSLTSHNYLSKAVENRVIELERQITIMLSKLYTTTESREPAGV